MSKRKRIPDFENEDKEREFWASRDSVDYIDWSGAERIRFPNLKPSRRSISLRLPQSMLEAIKNEANRRDIPYQSLIKVWLSERLEAELHPQD
jgi:predicted DNA binding CopG/RHH family protein